MELADVIEVRQNKLERKLFKKNSDNKCFYCGKTIRMISDKTLDHKNPLDRGGIDAASNYCIACKKCNMEKSNMTVKEYETFKILTQEWDKDITDIARSIVLEQIKLKDEVDWKVINKENAMQRYVNMLKEELIDKSKVKSKIPDEIPINKIILTPVAKFNQHHINYSSSKVQNAINNYNNGIITPFRVYKIQSCNDVYILLGRNSKYYAYKNILKLDTVSIDCVPLEDLSKKNILDIISCIPNNNEREQLLKRLLKIKSSNEENIISDEVYEGAYWLDVNSVRIPTSLRNNLAKLTPSLKRVKKIIDDYKVYNTIIPIRVCNNIPIKKLYVYYAYKYILKLDRIKVITVPLKYLSSKEKSFISSCVF